MITISFGGMIYSLGCSLKSSYNTPLPTLYYEGEV